MNIATLKEIIKDLPDNMEVLVSDADTDFTVQPATLAQVTNVVWSEDGTRSEPFSEEDCLIIK
ncbi:hypothetical protein [Tenacibaculum aestuarii]|uniref:hypothetical protein n=1 Tax=Tenacibaculum aestuarii TaxID=362781 RepID=UPI003895396D